MKVLMLSPIFPYPLNLGAKIRIYYVLRELARAGHEVTLVCLNEEGIKPLELEVIKSYCRRLEIVPVKLKSRTWTALRALFSHKTYGLAKFESVELRKRIADTLCEPYDVVWVHFMESLAYLPDFSLHPKPLVILDQHNADELFWANYARSGLPWVRFFAWQNIWKLRWFQRQVLRIVDVVLSVSEEDAAFTRMCLPNPSTQVWVVPNGVDTEYFQPQSNKERQNRIIFCGAMDIFMNIDAVVWFARNVFPKVREAVPDAEFWIVGRDPTPDVRALGAIPGVYVTGRVEDVRPYYAKAKVAIAPFRYGGGTKLKILEAMASGVPVVATPIGCQGIKAVSGRHLFIAERGEVFTNWVITLLREGALRERVAVEARRLVEQEYSWQGILREPISRLEQLVNMQSGSAKYI
ncbi:MAG: glycosyltransferase [Candidatus Methanomethylicaceae archaeon]